MESKNYTFSIIRTVSFGRRWKVSPGKFSDSLRSNSRRYFDNESQIGFYNLKIVRHSVTTNFQWTGLNARGPTCVHRFTLRNRVDILQIDCKLGVGVGFAINRNHRAKYRHSTCVYFRIHPHPPPPSRVFSRRFGLISGSVFNGVCYRWVANIPVDELDRILQRGLEWIGELGGANFIRTRSVRSA